jgi:hypothetical protein
MMECWNHEEIAQQKIIIHPLFHYSIIPFLRRHAKTLAKYVPGKRDRSILQVTI